MCFGALFFFSFFLNRTLREKAPRRVAENSSPAGCVLLSTAPVAIQTLTQLEQPRNIPQTVKKNWPPFPFYFLLCVCVFFDFQLFNWAFRVVSVTRSSIAFKIFNTEYIFCQLTPFATTRITGPQQQQQQHLKEVRESTAMFKIFFLST